MLFFLEDRNEYDGSTCPLQRLPLPFRWRPMRFSPMASPNGAPSVAAMAASLTGSPPLRQQAEAAGQTCLLHGGDTFQGSLCFNRFKGRANADLLALCDRMPW